MEKSLIGNRTMGLDVLKYLCCFLIILLHVEFPGKLDERITIFCRMAVPIFFMITGYFYTQTHERKRETKQIKKIFILFVVANLLYVVWVFAKLIMSGESVSEYVKGFLNVRTLIEFLVFNQSPHKNSVWYLSALLYALVLIWILGKLKISTRKLYPLIPFLIVANLILGTYSVAIFGREFSVVYSRNFIFCGLPYILLGDFIYNYKDRFKKSVFTVLIPVFLCTTVLEYLILSGRYDSFVQEQFISTFFLSFCVFNFFLKCENIFVGNAIFRKIAHFGQKYTLVIYVIHSIVIDFWIKGYGFISSKVESFSLALNILEPIVVLIVSTVCAWIASVIGKKLSKRS
ncbi:MAG: acyltransferase [Clostridia bacterium]|nr:acyltransferase [Clostridia bacterium]